MTATLVPKTDRVIYRAVDPRKRVRRRFTPLLADPDHSVSEDYGVWKEKNMYGKKSMGVERTTFVIDASGVIRKVFPRVKVDGHSDAVLAVLKTL